MSCLLYIPLYFLASILLVFFLTFFYLMDGQSIKVFCRTFRRDLKGIIMYIKVYLLVNYCRFRNLTLVDYFNKMVEKHPNKVCFIFEDEEWTFKQMGDLSDKIAFCFLQEGFKRGDEVALLMENCPDYICIWLGLGKIGVVTALINTNLKLQSLAHCMNVINIKGLIYGQNFAEELQKALPYIDKSKSAAFYCYSRKSENKINLPFPCEHLNTLLEDAPSSLSSHLANYKTNFTDNLLYIYTSGTTGFPKAAVVKHSRVVLAAVAATNPMQLNKSLIIYTTLPLYHSFGGLLFVSAVLMYGGKMVITKKFSASKFWKDVVKYRATACAYIGEICRYLLNQSKAPEETQHSVKLMVGLGLRPHIWKEFQDRFNIKKIVEMYMSTEGNVNLINFEGKTGAIGFISRIFHRIQGIYLLKIHPETGEVIRDSNGLCIHCKPGEPGELVGKISNNNPIKNFAGYLSTADTKKKIIKDCFRKGDMAFSSGDILVMDEDGYLYFRDRAGDTFRWKGENVSTTEVESIISGILNFETCVVYGVEIPGCEGRIGMAAIEVDDSSNLWNMDFEKFYKVISGNLPPYAVPAFIRISKNIEATGTYKIRKVNFKEEGYNPEKIDDPLYMLDRSKKTYIPLTKQIYHDIISGKIKF